MPFHVTLMYASLHVVNLCLYLSCIESQNVVELLSTQLRLKARNKQLYVYGISLRCIFHRTRSVNVNNLTFYASAMHPPTVSVSDCLLKTRTYYDDRSLGTTPHLHLEARMGLEWGPLVAVG